MKFRIRLLEAALLSALALNACAGVQPYGGNTLLGNRGSATAKLREIGREKHNERLASSERIRLVSKQLSEKTLSFTLERGYTCREVTVVTYEASDSAQTRTSKVFKGAEYPCESTPYAGAAVGLAMGTICSFDNVSMGTSDAGGSVVIDLGSLKLPEGTDKETVESLSLCVGSTKVDGLPERELLCSIRSRQIEQEITQKTARRDTLNRLIKEQGAAQEKIASSLDFDKLSVIEKKKAALEKELKGIGQSLGALESKRQGVMDRCKSDPGTTADTASITLPGSQAAERPAASSERCRETPTASSPDSDRPDTWRISLSALDKATPAAKEYLARLYGELQKQSQGFDEPLTQKEFNNLLRCENNSIYLDELTRVSSPISRKKQEAAHQDFSAIFMKPANLAKGVAFSKQYDALLAAAENTYGVKRYDIISILMWESMLGKFTGDKNLVVVFLSVILYVDWAESVAINSMSSQEKNENDIDSPAARSTREKRLSKLRERAVSNLAALLRIAKAKGTNPLVLTGSWAGAMGYPQFMPASFQYAVDGNHDHVIDLNNWEDVIPSVANYLREHKYERSRRNGILSYNHSDSYADGVIRYANEIERLSR